MKLFKQEFILKTLVFVLELFGKDYSPLTDRIFTIDDFRQPLMKWNEYLVPTGKNKPLDYREIIHHRHNLISTVALNKIELNKLRKAYHLASNYYKNLGVTIIPDIVVVGGLKEFAGIVYGEYQNDINSTYNKGVLYINADNVRRLKVEEIARTIVHEMVHILQFQNMEPYTQLPNIWVIEGQATIIDTDFAIKHGLEDNRKVISYLFYRNLVALKTATPELVLFSILNSRYDFYL